MCNQLKHQLLALAGQSATLMNSVQTEWASATFVGHKHEITFLFTDMSEGEAFVDAIENEVDVNLSGHILCDLKVAQVDSIVPLDHTIVVVEAFTLKD